MVKVLSSWRLCEKMLKAPQKVNCIIRQNIVIQKVGRQ